MATYIIDQLLMDENSEFLDELNFHILPSANPDGYEHSRNNVKFNKIILITGITIVFEYRIVFGERPDRITDLFCVVRELTVTATGTTILPVFVLLN